jgi:betaine-homocysteine S-methyltransferase
MYEEQIEWAVQADVDYIIAETLLWAEEAEIALATIVDAGLPAVVTFAVMSLEPETLDHIGIAEACRRLEAKGATVVGLNCLRGPHTMLPLLAEIRSAVDCWVAGLPSPYRTTENEPTYADFRFPDPGSGTSRRAAPDALDPFLCTRHETAQFALAAIELGVTYLGLCCGAGPHHVRSMAEALGRTPPASRYSYRLDMAAEHFTPEIAARWSA